MQIRGQPEERTQEKSYFQTACEIDKEKKRRRGPI